MEAGHGRSALAKASDLDITIIERYLAQKFLLPQMIQQFADAKQWQEEIARLKAATPKGKGKGQ